MKGLILLPKDTSAMLTKGLHSNNQELVHLIRAGIEPTAT